MNKIFYILVLNLLLISLILPNHIILAEFDPEHDSHNLPLYEQGEEIIVKFKTAANGGIDLQNIQIPYLNSAFFSYLPVNYQDLIINKGIGKAVEELIQDPNLVPLVGKVSDKLINLNIITFSQTDDLVLATVANLNKEPSIEYAEPNFIYNTLTNDAYYEEQWYLNNSNNSDIDYPEALSLYNQKANINQNIIAAVVDTGVEYNHPDLSGNMWSPSSCLDHNGDAWGTCPNHGAAFSVRGIGGSLNVRITDDPDPLDLDQVDSNDDLFWAYLKSNSHGTHVAGIIGATHNNVGVAGVAPNVKIMALQVNDDTPGLSVMAAAKALDFARYNGAKIVNASYGGDNTQTQDAFSRTHYDAVKRLRDAGILFIAAAGNGDPNNSNLGVDLDSSFISGGNYKRATYPCAYGSDSWSDNQNWPGLNNVICVAATNYSNGITYYSNYGAESVHVGAPGGSFNGLYNTVPAQYADYEGLDVDYDYKIGTSMATPVVTGLAAMIWAYQPNLTYSEVRNIILTTGDSLADLNGKTTTGKRVNAYNALLEVDENYSDEENSCQSAPVISSPSSNQTVNNSLRLQWQAITGANSYDVRYGTSSNLSNASSTNTTNNYLDLNLNNGAYYWQVRAVCP